MDPKQQNDNQGDSPANLGADANGLPSTPTTNTSQPTVEPASTGTTQSSQKQASPQATSDSKNHDFLLNDEHIIIEMKKNIAPLIIRLFVGLTILSISILGPIIALQGASSRSSVSTIAYFVLVIGLFGLILSLFIFIPSLIHYLTDYLCLTDRRVYGKVGLFHTYELDVPLDKIQSISVDRTLFGKMFNYAAIDIRAVNRGWKFPLVTNANEFRKSFYENKQTNTRGSSSSD